MRAGRLIDEGLPIKLTEKGRELSLEVKAEREFESLPAHGQFEATLRLHFPVLDEENRRKALSFV